MKLGLVNRIGDLLNQLHANVTEQPFAIVGDPAAPRVRARVKPFPQPRCASAHEPRFRFCHRFGIAHVENFVRYAGFDVNEIAGFVFDRLLAALPEFVANFSFDDVKDYFEANMNMRIRNAARRNSGDIR